MRGIHFQSRSAHLVWAVSLWVMGKGVASVGDNLADRTIFYQSNFDDHTLVGPPLSDLPLLPSRQFHAYEWRTFGASIPRMCKEKPTWYDTSSR